MTTVTLPEELTSYLISHPDLFADVLAHAFAKKQRHVTAPARTFGMPKTKRDAESDDDDDDLPLPKRARVVLPDGFQEDLIADVRGVIYQQVVDMMDSDDEILVAVLHLAAVSKTIRGEVLPKMQQFLGKTDLIGVMCSNVVMYFDQPRTRDLYIDALQYKAPAVYMAWKTLLREPAWSNGLTKYLVPIIRQDLKEIPYFIRSGRDPVFIFASLLLSIKKDDPTVAELSDRYATFFKYKTNELVAFAMDYISADILDRFEFLHIEQYLEFCAIARKEDVQFLNELFACVARLGRFKLFAEKILNRAWYRSDLLNHFLGAIIQYGTGEVEDRIREAVDLIINPWIERNLTRAKLAWTRFGVVLIQHGVSLDTLKLFPQLMESQGVFNSAVSWHRADVIETFYSDVGSGPWFADGLNELFHPPSDRIRILSGAGQLATYEALMRAIVPSTESMLVALDAALVQMRPFTAVSNELYERLTMTIPLKGKRKRLLEKANIAWKVATANVFDPKAWAITTDRFEDVMTGTDDATIRAEIVFMVAMRIDYGDPVFMRSLVKHFVTICDTIERRDNLSDDGKDFILHRIFALQTSAVDNEIHWSNFWIYVESDIGLAFYERSSTRLGGVYVEYVGRCRLRFILFSAEPWRAVLFMLRTPKPKDWLRDVYKEYHAYFRLLHPSAQTPAAVKFFIENLQAYAQQSNGTYDEPINEMDDVSDLSSARELAIRDLEFFKRA